jgi:hypothetical protein
VWEECRGWNNNQISQDNSNTNPGRRNIWKDIEIVDHNHGVKKRGRPKAVPKEKVKELVSRTEDAVKVNIWKDGHELCTVGFVSKAFVTIYGFDLLDGRVAEITYVHAASTYECDRIRSNELNGLARATIIG